MTNSTTRLLRNGRIFTSKEGDNELHEALLVDGEDVVFVGKENEARKILQARQITPVETDLNGSVVLPGIIDAHTHLTQFGSSMAKVDCLGKTVEQVQEALAEYRKANPDAKMILGRSFLFDALGKAPHKSYLDEVIPDIPVFIDSGDVHSTWLNSAAIKAVGVDESTPNLKGGEFQKDKDGKLTGLFLEQATFELVWPWVGERTLLEERIANLELAFEAYHATGVTAAVDMAMVAEDLEAFEVYFERHKRLPIRVYAHWLLRPSGNDESRAHQVREAARHRERLAHMAPWLQVIGVKAMCDGVVDSCTAFLKEPYYNGTNGDPIWPEDELTKVTVLADSLDLQVAIHAIGDRASEIALNCFETAIKQNGPRPLRRHRIEHLEVVTQESIQRLTRLGITASLQPVHADPIFLPNWRLMLGEDKRCDRAFPWSEYVESRSHVAFGSDAPTAPHHCLPNMFTATTRESGVNPKLAPSKDPRIIALKRFCIKLETAVRFYTSGSAYSIRGENKYGVLEPGKSADFCVLNIDPFLNGVETLQEAQEGVEQTWIAGEQVWKRK